MDWKVLRRHCLSALCAAFATLGFCADAAARSTTGAAPAAAIDVVSGGVGDESKAQLQQMKNRFDLKLTFATKDGHYLAGVPVRITDASHNEFVDTVSEGPFLMASLPPGEYRVTAAFSGKSITHSITVTGRGMKEDIFRWANPMKEF